MKDTLRGLVLDEAQRRALRELERSGATPQALAFRARLVLRCEELGAVKRVAEAERTTRPTVSLWRDRFLAAGIDGLKDAPRPGRPVTLSTRLDAALSETAPPPSGRTRWSTRTMARHAGVSKSSVQTLWARNEFKPHLTRIFGLPGDTRSGPRFWDVVGLYLQPPQKTLVFCCDEMRAGQAPDCARPGLSPDAGALHAHDYARHGTITLLAALGYLEGKILGAIPARHTHAAWLDFLAQLEGETPPGLALHLIVDDRTATHAHVKAKAWLAARPRFHLHVTPSGSSWLTLIEHGFRALTATTLREGSLGSVRELTGAIERFLAGRNLVPKPYRWQKGRGDF